MYLRDENLPPLASLKLNVKDLTAVFSKTLIPYDKVFTGYSNFREEAKRTLAFGSETTSIIFVGYDANDIVEDIWLDRYLANRNEKELAMNALIDLATLAELLLVDWDAGIVLELSDREKIVSYLDL